MRVTYFQNTDGGCDYYRAVSPIETSSNYGAIKSKRIFSDAMIGFYLTQREKFDELMKCDVYFTQRIGSQKFVNSLRNYIQEYKSNAKIIMDFDDNVFNVSPLSAHYKDYGTKDIKIVMPDGSEHWAWKDGENIDCKRNQQTIDEIKRNLESVDMVTTTTEILADVFREYNSNVRTLPNCVDLNIWEPLKVVRKRPDEIRMYWGGGQSHSEDLLMIREPLKIILEKYKNLKLVVMGWLPQGFIEYYGKDRIEFHEWVSTVAYPYKVRALDIDFGIIPLRDTEFNRCKSSIKWVELASLEIPAVVSYVSPYREIEGLSSNDNSIYIENNDSQSWVEGITHLIENNGARHDIGVNARKVVEEHFDINTQYHQWVNTLQEVACQSPAHRQ